MNYKKRPTTLRRIRSAVVYPFALAGNFIVKALQWVEQFARRSGVRIGKVSGYVGKILLPAVIVKSVKKGFQRAGKLVRTLTQILVPWRLFKQIGGSLDKVWNAIWRLILMLVAALLAVLNRIVPPGVRRWFRRRLWRPLWRGGAAISGFLKAWSRSRDYRRLLGALPAFLLLLPLVACLAKSQFTSERSKIHHYRQAALNALDEEDYATADLCYRKLAQLGQSQRVEFEAALAKAAEGNLEAAYAAVRKMAPLDEPGYPPAHFWIAQQLVQGKLDVPQEQRWELAEKHIQIVLDRNPRDLSAQWLEASMLVSAEKPQAAISRMEQLVHQIPSLRLPLAELYMKQGRTDEAAAEARRLLRFYDQQGGAEQVLQPHEYLVWASTALALGELQLARQVLDKGLEILPDDERLAALSIQLQLASYDNLSRGSGSMARRIELLQPALQLSPDDEKVLQRMLGLARELGVAHETFQAIVRPVLEAEQSQSNGHSQADPTAVSKTFELVNLLGFVAHEEQNHALAVKYFEQQLEVHPHHPLAANNLAYELRFVSPVDLERAFQLADQAVTTEPGNPAYRETRGQLLVRLKRWQEAVEDLEMAVNALPEEAEIHESLATAYTELGNDELAELHRGQLE